MAEAQKYIVEKYWDELHQMGYFREVHYFFECHKMIAVINNNKINIIKSEKPQNIYNIAQQYKIALISNITVPIEFMMHCLLLKDYYNRIEDITKIIIKEKIESPSDLYFTEMDLGIGLSRTKDNEAISHLLKALEYKPHDCDAIYELAKYYRNMDNTKAMDYLHMAIISGFVDKRSIEYDFRILRSNSKFTSIINSLDEFSNSYMGLIFNVGCSDEGRNIVIEQCLDHLENSTKYLEFNPDFLITFPPFDIFKKNPRFEKIINKNKLEIF